MSAPSKNTAAAAASSPSPSHWHHPHLTCGAYTGPPSVYPATPELADAWRAHVVAADTDLAYERYAPVVRRIWDAVAERHQGYARLETLCTEFGARISGSSTLERAIDWAAASMRDEDRLEEVRTEPVDVPSWIRGVAKCSVDVVAAPPADAAIATGGGGASTPLAHSIQRRIDLDVLAIGLSVGTVPIAQAKALAAEATELNMAGASSAAATALLAEAEQRHTLHGELLVVDSFATLDALVAADPHAARGKIILFNHRFTSYAENVPYRGYGAARAEAVGAIGAIVRSVTPISLYTPHTGSMAPSACPVVCCTVEDAETIAKLAARGLALRAHLFSSAFLEARAQSRNLLAELRGRERPEEIVLLGAHIDSWNVGQGAHDDGQGCMVAWDVVRILSSLGLRPRRTIRVVLFTDEEVESSGAAAYFQRHASELAQYQAVLETDLGAYTSQGFGVVANAEAKRIIAELLRLLAPYHADTMTPDGPGVDVHPLADAGVPALLLWFDKQWTGNDYFAYHHTKADTFDKIDPAMMLQNTQVLAAMTYLLAEIPERLPHSRPNSGTKCSAATPPPPPAAAVANATDVAISMADEAYERDEEDWSAELGTHPVAKAASIPATKAREADAPPPARGSGIGWKPLEVAGWYSGMPEFRSAEEIAVDAAADAAATPDYQQSVATRHALGPLSTLLEQLRRLGFEPAPPGHPRRAAFELIPDFGIRFVEAPPEDLVVEDEHGQAMPSTRQAYEANRKASIEQAWAAVHAASNR